MNLANASAWALRFLPLILKNNGPVLDLACGSGRHTRMLLDAGYEVWALDRDATLLEPLALLGARCFQIDLEQRQLVDETDGKVGWPFDVNTFSGIIVTNYLYRPLLSNLTLALKEGGILIYETFAVGNEAFGSPRNQDFLLQPGELIEYYLSQAMPDRKNHCIAFEHGRILHPRPAVVQRICLRSVSLTSAIDTSVDQLDCI